ncbi:sugar kinase [Myceligenerans pegani]|uniref:Sugar kinase n=1 Tax=Myceligenerans pegani TaxID=2776917 RepID=A0ABR9MV53_9MICO|nr:sugar kinase [Myceligenerans sp. TRM 65318]MBE1875266.1 sugar kinase [Myceligenerans sp. TRM 65318]MBE3017537.1 sugar kinase [Myceligenerans sp. TRM 65318]
MTNPSLSVRPAAECRYDVVALGEVMLRLDPGERRVRNARRFDVWEGGGEYNVARGLRRCFGLRGAIVTALANNDVGRLVEDLMLAGGLDTSWVQWCDFDGIGRQVRNGLNFTERGFGVRGALGVSDRGHTAASQMRPEDVDWEALFSGGARWLHTGGIFAALSESTAEVAEVAMAAARKHGTVVSYDLNYRPSLWKGIGGVERAREVNRRLARHVDVMIGNEEDFTASLGFEVEGVSEDLRDLDTGAFRAMIERVSGEYGNFQVIATTLRGVQTATVNDWGAIAWSRAEGFAEATHRPGLEILDRVGGGDSFASGLAYGLMELDSLAEAVQYGAAHGALAMTTPGDTTTATLAEVAKLAGGGSARVDR